MVEYKGIIVEISDAHKCVPAREWLPILLQHDWEVRIGSIYLYLDSGVFKGDIKLLGEYSHLIPSIGYSVDREVDPNIYKVFCVGLCDNNSDPNMKSIESQIENQILGI